MNYARLSIKIMKSYARIFTVGEPIVSRYQGWVEWGEGKKDKALQSWRAAAEKAEPIPMHYEEGMACLTLAKHLPDGEERSANLQRAKKAFTRGGFVNWAYASQTIQR